MSAEMSDVAKILMSGTREELITYGLSLHKGIANDRSGWSVVGDLPNDGVSVCINGKEFCCWFDLQTGILLRLILASHYDPNLDNLEGLCFKRPPRLPKHVTIVEKTLPDKNNQQQSIDY
jgi:hypothetical protein